MVLDVHTAPLSRLSWDFYKHHRLNSELKKSHLWVGKLAQDIKKCTDLNPVTTEVSQSLIHLFNTHFLSTDQVLWASLVAQW